jgi:hypothetical protein
MKGRELNPQFNVLAVLERGVSFDKRKVLGLPAGDGVAPK